MSDSLEQELYHIRRVNLVARDWLRKTGSTHGFGMLQLSGAIFAGSFGICNGYWQVVLVTACNVADE